ncbi:MAG: heat-inducible transcriptional repressor HrcA [Dictyoglomus sp.]|nr:heat-inducible transcriptional repressor HrcA [Dictyoglomus sp.]MCX7941682.1 heat-inducible transcriptional repressor HrcA [Dictyoglomaceae bacterium]MDW8188166.1 heat-inducible transcriptional repressor HrcA [Dictyoglomus sp.]
MLDERKQKILRITVKDYIESAQPVSSRVLAKKYHLGWSPATIRNEMADLEEAGYLIQPHTSAGRIPSDRGYRFYVDFLMDLEPPTQEDVEYINYSFLCPLSWENLLQQVAEVLSQRTAFIGVVLFPQLNSSFLKKIELVELNENVISLIMTTSTGIVKERIIKLSDPLQEFELYSIKESLNRSFSNEELQKVYWLLLDKKIPKDIPVEIYQGLEQLLWEVLEKEKEEGVFIAGISRIFRHLEFQDINKVKDLLSVLEEEKTLTSLLFSAFLNHGLTILIGNEIGISELSDCSIITTVYSLKNNVIGTLGMIGPKRMKYERMLTLVELMGKVLSEKLSEFFDK